MAPIRDLFDKTFCETFNVLPVPRGEGVCELVVSHLSDLSIINYVRFRTESRIQLLEVSQAELSDRIGRQFDTRTLPTGRSDAEVAITGGDSERVIGLIDKLLAAAMDDQASDLHFESSATSFVCRGRLDGILHVRQKFSLDLAPAVLSRIKIMSKLDIAEKRRPQDGRIRFKHKGRTIDIRVSVIPTDFGEKAVLRILDKESLRLDVGELGMTPSQRTLFEERISQPHGIILVTGPTGSGKTTTLYAALNYLKSDEVNITTIEDPIEYNLEGINQTAVQPGIGVTFASMLRSFLRQDPNILMVGEIRDAETLEIAIQASLTGHLVLSTIHTNDAIATIARLIDMGAEPNLLSSTLRLIVAQRLVRCICPKCFDSTLPESMSTAALKLGCELSAQAGCGTGCDNCLNTGYKGRTSLYELLPIDRAMRQAIERRSSEDELRRLAIDSGFINMKQRGIELINTGRTTTTEVLREVNT